MTSNALAVQNGNLAVDQHRGELSTSDLETLRATVLKGASDAQLRLYARTCRSRGLDPFAKEIHGWADRNGGVEIVVGIDGLRNLAESSGEYRGQDGPWYCGQDKEWTEVWLGPGKPLAAKVCVKREGMQPVCNVALLTECERNTPVWRTQLSTMLAIRAEAQAIRRLFPRQTTGLYAEGELPDHEDTETPEPTPHAATAPTARPTPIPVQVVNEDTGEIGEPIRSMEDVKRMTGEFAKALNLDAKAVQQYAKSINANYRTLEGAIQLCDALEDLLLEQEDQDDDEEDYEGIEAQGTLLDADTVPIEREY